MRDLKTRRDSRVSLFVPFCITLIGIFQLSHRHTRDMRRSRPYGRNVRSLGVCGRERERASEQANERARPYSDDKRARSRSRCIGAMQRDDDLNEAGKGIGNGVEKSLIPQTWAFLDKLPDFFPPFLSPFLSVSLSLFLSLSFFLSSCLPAYP